jgi:hypothetical protein
MTTAEFNPMELEESLRALHIAEKNLKNIISQSGLRFSINKVTGDLGEYYAYSGLSQKKDLFDSVRTEKSSNASSDMLGVITKSSILYKLFEKNELRIEVKTRRKDHGGVTYLSSVKPDKFDILCVVHLGMDYSLTSIHLINTTRVTDELDTKYNRLLFKSEMAFLKI